MQEFIATFVSAGRRRRRRLRFVMTTLMVLVVATGALGYAVHRGGDDPSPSAVGSGAQAGAAVGRSTPEAGRPPEESPPAPADAPAGGRAALAPVVTDRIPAPTTSIALSDPVPGTTNMQAPAAAAVRSAFAAARRAGERPGIRSAWRSAEWQQVLFDRALVKYGSRSEATKWVLPPQESAHVKGYAVDVSPLAAAQWLEAHGAAYGLCRTYDNEWWHFEYLATATCPPRQPTAAG